jgi:hypothetical protein
MLLMGGALFSASAAPIACSGGASLLGWYGMLVSGGGKYLSGAINFDGNCNVTGGSVTGGSGGQYVTTSVTGAYGQNSDGTFTITLNLAGQSTPQTYMVGISESGNKARGLQSNAGSLEATIDLQSQLTTLTSRYSTASLSGAYAASCFGSGAADLNYVTFDSNGNVSVIDDYDNGSGQGNNTLSGTYSVNGDGTFSGSLTGSYSFNGVIDNGVSEIEYTYATSESGGVLACIGKQAQAAPANLLGRYGFVVGETSQSAAGGEYFSGSINFDGAGKLSGANVNGGINTQYGNTSVTGSYSLNPDNTITITMNLANPATTQSYVVGVSESGNEASGIQTDGAAITTINLQSQLQVPAVPYSTASLNGTYSASCGGFEVDLNYATFDGNGNITAGVDAYDSGWYGDSPYTGTYTVNSDGTFSAGFAPPYDMFTLTGVLDNGTAEMEYTYYQAGVGGVVSCTGESTYGPIGTATAAATPTFSPAPGAYSLPQFVTLSDTPGAVIYYTTNGTTPTTNSPVYSTPVPVNATTTIEAIAVATGFNNSAIAAGTYFQQGTPTAATPTFSPAPGFYSLPQSVTLSDTTPGAVIYYTTDGTTPTASSPVYSTPISVSATTTIQAIAVSTCYGNSGIAAGTYSFVQSQTIAFSTIPTQTYPAGPLTLNATASSGLPVSYAILSGPATVSGNLLTITGAGSVTVQASQAGNTQYSPASPVSQTFTVSQASTTLALTSSSNPSSPGQLVTFAATITPQFGGQASGTVTFKDGSAILSIVSVSGNVASLTTSALAIGTHSISSIYGGDANFTGSTSSPLAQVVAKAATTTALVSSLNPSGSGKVVTFTATVTSPAGTPTGTVKFLNGATVQAIATLKSGTAKYPTTKLPPGSNSITAAYTGDSNNGSSTSAVLTQFVLAVTTTTLTSSPNPSVYDQTVTFTVTLTSSIGAPPDGETVTFEQGTNVLGTGVLSGGTATFSTSALPVGTKAIKAIYGGDAIFISSTSAALSQVIGKEASTTTLTSSPNPSTFGQSVTFTAVVAPRFGGTPTGTVVFKDGGKTLGSVSLSGGSASYTISNLARGAHSITATYNGSTSFIGSSGPLTQTVN